MAKAIGKVRRQEEREVEESLKEVERGTYHEWTPYIDNPSKGTLRRYEDGKLVSVEENVDYMGR